MNKTLLPSVTITRFRTVQSQRHVIYMSFIFFLKEKISSNNKDEPTGFNDIN